MALDARARASASGMLTHWPVGIRPNGSLDQEGRQAAGWGYSGVLAEAPVVVIIPGTVAWTLEVRSLDWTMQSRDIDWGLEVRLIDWTLLDRDTDG